MLSPRLTYSILGSVFLLTCSLAYSEMFSSAGQTANNLPHDTEPLVAQNQMVNASSSAQMEYSHERVMFIGDISLARQVERLNKQYGSGYSFEQAAFLRQPKQYVFANFEGAIPEIHQPTPNFTFRFSVPLWLANSLKSSGVTHLSLANNHSFDFGEAGYNETNKQLASLGLLTFGHPTKISTSSVSVVEFAGVRLSVIALHTLFLEPDRTALQDIITYAEAQSDIQAAYIHWGEEYNKVPSKKQRDLAQFLTGAGVDFIIGHHPHVVQAIEVINDAPVLYSLGNFIFDQYFSTAVQEGLVATLLHDEGQFYLDLLPITSVGTPAQPRIMSAEEGLSLLSELSELSSEAIRSEITAGRIKLKSLASLPKTAIMTQ